MRVSLKNTSLKQNTWIFQKYYGIAVYDEISNWEKINVKDTRKCKKKKFSASPQEPKIESPRESLGE